MSTDAQLAAAGSGTVAYALAVEGLGVMTDRSDWYPLSATYGATRHYDYLVSESLPDIREQIDPLEGCLEVEDISIELADIDGDLTGLVSEWRVLAYSYLTASMTADQTTAAVDDVSWALTTGGTVWCQGEAMTYLSASDDAITGLTRGALDTTASVHTVDLHRTPVLRPVIADGMSTLIGRRALLYRAPVDVGGVGTASCIYRGRVVGMRMGHGIWRLDIEHISSVFHEEVCGTMGRSACKPGYFISGHPARCTPKIAVLDDMGLSAVVTSTMDAGWYDHAGHLAHEWEMTVNGDSSGVHARFESGEKYKIITGGSTGERYKVRVVEGDPLWMLGFAPGTYEGADGESIEIEAENEPFPLAVDLKGTRADPEIRVADVRGTTLADLSTGDHVAVTGCPWHSVLSVTDEAATYSDRIFLSRNRDPLAPDYWAVKDAEDLVCQQVYVGRAALLTIFSEMLGLDDDSPLWPAYFRSEDFDSAEWSAAIDGAPVALRSMRTLVVTEGTNLWDIFGPHFGVLGVVPRITSDGKIGAMRLETPTPQILEDVELDADVWSLDHATDIEARVDHAALLNTVKIEHSYSYWEGEFSGSPITCIWDDGLATLKQTRSITYPLRGVSLERWTETELAMVINSEVVATHFGQFGRGSTVLEVPCTWTAKQIKCGDYVKITHSLAPDTVMGAIGVTDRPALVLGRVQSLTGKDPDALMVQVYPPITGGAIAPCLRSASYLTAAAALEISTSTAYAQSGSTDLDWLTTTHLPAAVRAVARDSSTTPATTWDLSVTAVSGAYVLLGNEGFSSAWPGAIYLTLPDWDRAASWQQEYAYHAGNSTIPTLGSDADTSKEWTI